MSRSTTPLYIEERLLARAREQASRTGRDPAEVVEEALERHFSEVDVDELLHEIWAHSPDDLSEEDSLAFAYDELHAARAERRLVG